MIALPTVSAELDAVGREPFEAFARLLEEEYPLVHAHLECERPSEFGLLYRWPGRSDERPVVLMAHYDVVPARAEDGWTHDPFAGVVADGVVHGRGTLDDKGPLLVILEAVENLLAAGFTPAQDVYLSFGGNEESYGDAAPIASDLLHERGIRPELVVGTSAGSVIGAAYAAGMDPYELEELVLDAHWGDFGTFSFMPGLGILDTEGLRQTIDHVAGGDRLLHPFDGGLDAAHPRPVPGGAGLRLAHPLRC